MRLWAIFSPRGPEWEFEACLQGCLSPVVSKNDKGGRLREQTLWAFPSYFAHGWRNDAPCERVVFHFSKVPSQLEQNLPVRGYYRRPLSDADCERLRELAMRAKEAHSKPTERLSLQDDTLLGELSLLALREVPARALPQAELAIRKADMALSWYTLHMAENPGVDEVARAVHACPSYLRRLCHRAYGISPQQAFIRRRLQVAEELLEDPELTLEAISERIGFASAATLSRAIKRHYKVGARELRRRKSRCHARFSVPSGP